MQSYHNIGVIYSWQTKYEDALKMYDKSLELTKRFGGENSLETAQVTIFFIKFEFDNKRLCF